MLSAVVKFILCVSFIVPAGIAHAKKPFRGKTAKVAKSKGDFCATGKVYFARGCRSNAWIVKEFGLEQMQPLYPVIGSREKLSKGELTVTQYVPAAGPRARLRDGGAT